MPVRCFQCKTPVGGRGSGTQHALATGHTWQPGYYCQHCEATFSNYQACRKHVKQCCPGGAPSLPSVATNAEDALAHPKPEGTHTSTTCLSSSYTGADTTGGEQFRLVSNEYKCPKCKLKFADQQALSQVSMSHHIRFATRLSVPCTARRVDERLQNMQKVYFAWQPATALSPVDEASNAMSMVQPWFRQFRRIGSCTLVSSNGDLRLTIF